jgi:catechol 2,3-dioxygenase-like lactoylglutathione lyase family enzyme
MQYPIVFSHVGLSVANIEKAIEFYKEVFGWYHLAGPWPIKRDGGSTSKFCDTVYGENWTGFKLAHMSTGDHVGIELLEFEGNYPPKEKLEFKRQGLFHFGIQTNDVEGFIKNLEAHGGRQHSLVSQREVNGLTYKAVYAEDPFGNIFEIYSCSYEVMAR